MLGLLDNLCRKSADDLGKADHEDRKGSPTGLRFLPSRTLSRKAAADFTVDSSSVAKTSLGGRRSIAEMSDHVKGVDDVDTPSLTSFAQTSKRIAVMFRALNGDSDDGVVRSAVTRLVDHLLHLL